MVSALAALEKGNTDAALGKLGAFDNKLGALLKSKRISQADYQTLIDYSKRLQTSIKG